MIGVGVGRGETREGMGRQRHGETELVMLQWGCWEVDIGLGRLWCRDRDSGGYVGCVVATNEWEGRMDGQCFSHATFA